MNTDLNKIDYFCELNDTFRRIVGKESVKTQCSRCVILQ